VACARILHGTIGAAQTTIRAIAGRAGVQRLTVHRHFPDEHSLTEACSGHARATMPPPDLDRWREIADPDERLRAGLLELYDYFRGTEGFWRNTLRDAEVDATVREMVNKSRLPTCAKPSTSAPGSR
jgi:AcrR family transcriptional regulator